jgi:hypothetical protein
MELETAIKYTEKHKIKALFIFEDKGKAKLIFSKELQKVKM